VKQWTAKRVDVLCELVASGFSFADCARALDIPRAECAKRFEQIRESYGRQVK
jgi:hypothetical protein